MMSSIKIIFMHKIFCVIVLGQRIEAKNQSKRLLLDGDTALDLGGEISKLRTQFLDYQIQMNSSNTKLEQKLRDFQYYHDTQMNTTNTKLAEVQKENERLKQMLVNSQSAGQVYVRWGRNVCPETANFVYKGYMGGKHYNNKGSGTNHLCLPRDPTWLNYTIGVNVVARAFVYGTEIDIDDRHQVFGYPVNEQDMPCAVCQSNHRTTMMIPARESCYSGWTQEYRGYIMAGSYRATAYEYICLDKQPEFLTYGYTNDNQHILYIAEARCGSLPCPPYVEGRELACVVCSK